MSQSCARSLIPITIFIIYKPRWNQTCKNMSDHMNDDSDALDSSQDHDDMHIKPNVERDIITWFSEFTENPTKSLYIALIYRAMLIMPDNPYLHKRVYIGQVHQPSLLHKLSANDLFENRKIQHIKLACSCKNICTFLQYLKRYTSNFVWDILDVHNAHIIRPIDKQMQMMLWVNEKKWADSREAELIKQYGGVFQTENMWSTFNSTPGNNQSNKHISNYIKFIEGVRHHLNKNKTSTIYSKRIDKFKHMRLHDRRKFYNANKNNNTKYHLLDWTMLDEDEATTMQKMANIIKTLQERMDNVEVMCNRLQNTLSKLEEIICKCEVVN